MKINLKKDIKKYIGKKVNFCDGLGSTYKAILTQKDYDEWNEKIEEIEIK